MRGEVVRGVYDVRYKAEAVAQVIDTWGMALPHIHVMSLPWWARFASHSWITARLREEYGYLDWSDE